MKLSTNMVVQVLGTLGQTINAFMDIIPPKYKPIAAAVIGTIQLWSALLGHKSNPDGTPATEAYKATPRIPSILPILLCLILLGACMPSLQAQDSPKIGAFGLAYDDLNKPNLAGWGALAIPVAPRTLSYTDYDVSPVSTGGQFALGKIRLQYSIRTGAAFQLKTLKPGVTLYGLGGAGLSADSLTLVGSFSGGGFLDIAFGKGWGALIIVQEEKNAVTGAHFTPRIGIRKAL